MTARRSGGRGGGRRGLPKLSDAQLQELDGWRREHGEALARRGYSTRTVVDQSGCFGAVLVEDTERGRLGMLTPGGEIRWLDQAQSIASLADANVNNFDPQRPPGDQPPSRPG